MLVKAGPTFAKVGRAKIWTKSTNFGQTLAKPGPIGQTWPNTTNLGRTRADSRFSGHLFDKHLLGNFRGICSLNRNRPRWGRRHHKLKLQPPPCQASGSATASGQDGVMAGAPATTMLSDGVFASRSSPRPQSSLAADSHVRPGAPLRTKELGCRHNGSPGPFREAPAPSACGQRRPDVRRAKLAHPAPFVPSLAPRVCTTDHRPRPLTLEHLTLAAHFGRQPPPYRSRMHHQLRCASNASVWTRRPDGKSTILALEPHTNDRVCLSCNGNVGAALILSIPQGL